ARRRPKRRTRQATAQDQARTGLDGGAAKAPAGRSSPDQAQTSAPWGLVAAGASAAAPPPPEAGDRHQSGSQPSVSSACPVLSAPPAAVRGAGAAGRASAAAAASGGGGPPPVGQPAVGVVRLPGPVSPAGGGAGRGGG